MTHYFRFWPVFMRNLLVWRKLVIPSLIANIAEPLMWLVAFGYGMGALIGDVYLGWCASALSIVLGEWLYLYECDECSHL